jgi:hypothetical protein
MSEDWSLPQRESQAGLNDRGEESLKAPPLVVSFGYRVGREYPHAAPTR